MRLTKEQATRRGKAMLRKMKTKGWKIRVHENIGWHYTLVCGSIMLNQESDCGLFYILCDDWEPPMGGRPDWLVRKHFKDPNQAVENQMIAMQCHVQRLAAQLTRNIKLLEGRRPLPRTK